MNLLQKHVKKTYNFIIQKSRSFVQKGVRNTSLVVNPTLNALPFF